MKNRLRLRRSRRQTNRAARQWDTICRCDRALAASIRRNMPSEAL